MHTAVDVLDSKKNAMDLNHNLNNYFLLWLLYDNMNLLNATELYTEKCIRQYTLCYIYFVTLFK